MTSPTVPDARALAAVEAEMSRALEQNPDFDPDETAEVTVTRWRDAIRAALSATAPPESHELVIARLAAAFVDVCESEETDEHEQSYYFRYQALRDAVMAEREAKGGRT